MDQIHLTGKKQKPLLPGCVVWKQDHYPKLQKMRKKLKQKNEPS